MKNPVIAIGLDGADPSLIEQWMAQGYLKTMSRLQEQGVYARLKTCETYVSEAAWPTLLTGCLPQQTGHWTTVKFDENAYEVSRSRAYSASQYPPFYSLRDERRVAIFDIPKVGRFPVHGTQILGWGARANAEQSQVSEPAELLPSLIERYGEFPLLSEDVNVLSRTALAQLQENLKTAIARRTAICQDLLEREPWDLFFTVFSETHYAAHGLWHLSQSDHPLHQSFTHEGDALRDIFQAVDRAIAQILAVAPPQTPVVIFSDCSTVANVTDVPSMLLLPEFLYRYNFPGQYGIALGKAGTPPPPPLTGTLAKRGWCGMAWSLKHESNPLKKFFRPKLPSRIFALLEPLLGDSPPIDLVSPLTLHQQGHPLYYQPAVWYKPFWPQMKAFALPSFSDGRIRINLQGRESQGVVPASAYQSLCDELREKLTQLTDARTGKPLVKQIIQTRESPADRDPKLPDADLVVMWQDEHVTDVIDSPEFGRIGPVPFIRTGGHRAEGFLLAQGAEIPVGAFSSGHCVDVAPTILSLMNAPLPPHYQGKPLISTLKSVV